MNKQRQVLITTTYNEMGIIVDIKAEKVEQPNLQPTCNQLATDCISRQQTITALRALSDEDGYINAPHEVVTDVVRGLPPVQAEQGQTTQPEQTKTDKLGVKAGKTYTDTISIKAAIDIIEDFPHGGVWNVESMEEMVYRIKQLPPAQTERKKGMWIHDGRDFPHGVDWIHCSVCGKKGINVPADLTNFCPNCGADMRGEADG